MLVESKPNGHLTCLPNELIYKILDHADEVTEWKQLKSGLRRGFCHTCALKEDDCGRSPEGRTRFKRWRRKEDVRQAKRHRQRAVAHAVLASNRLMATSRLYTDLCYELFWQKTTWTTKGIRPIRYMYPDPPYRGFVNDLQFEELHDYFPLRRYNQPVPQLILPREQLHRMQRLEVSSQVLDMYIIHALHLFRRDERYKGAVHDFKPSLVAIWNNIQACEFDFFPGEQMRNLLRNPSKAYHLIHFERRWLRSIHTLTIRCRAADSAGSPIRTREVNYATLNAGAGIVLPSRSQITNTWTLLLPLFPALKEVHVARTKLTNKHWRERRERMVQADRPPLRPGDDLPLRIYEDELPRRKDVARSSSIIRPFPWVETTWPKIHEALRDHDKLVLEIIRDLIEERGRAEESEPEPESTDLDAGGVVVQDVSEKDRSVADEKSAQGKDAERWAAETSTQSGGDEMQAEAEVPSPGQEKPEAVTGDKTRNEASSAKTTPVDGEKKPRTEQTAPDAGIAASHKSQAQEDDSQPAEEQCLPGKEEPEPAAGDETQAGSSSTNPRPTNEAEKAPTEQPSADADSPAKQEAGTQGEQRPESATNPTAESEDRQAGQTSAVATSSTERGGENEGEWWPPEPDYSDVRFRLYPPGLTWPEFILFLLFCHAGGLAVRILLPMLVDCLGRLWSGAEPQTPLVWVEIMQGMKAACGEYAVGGYCLEREEPGWCPADMLGPLRVSDR